jgi:sulfate permease, SulP family
MASTETAPGFRPRLPDLSAGTLSALVTLSYSISYGAMIFSGDLGAYLPSGMMTALIACGVVAIVVAAMSSFHFAMAGPDSNATAVLAVTMAAIAAAVGMKNPAAVLPTVLAALMLSAVLCGIILYAIGASKRGRYVRFIPYPVIGGFLAGTGYLVLDGAVKMMTRAPLSLDTFNRLALSPPPAMFWVPALAVTVPLFFLRRSPRLHLILPVVLATSALALFAWMLAARMGIDEAREKGILFAPMTAGRWMPSWRMDYAAVDWEVLSGQAGPFLAMTMVVVVTILLNATGLDLSGAENIDFNKELKACGAASVASGLAGGMLGYISISRSLINLRAGAKSRAAGMFAGALCLAAAFMFPEACGYVPRPVLTGLLLYLGFSMLAEWVWDAAWRMPRFDWLLVLLILALIAGWGFLTGVTFGVILASLLFVVNYSRLSPVKHAFTGDRHPSNVERSAENARRLQESGGRVYALALQGYLFFGTSSTILDEVKSRADRLRFVLIDFRLVQGMDMSAVFSFTKLRQLCERKEILLALTGLTDSSRAVFGRMRFAMDDEIVKTFPDMDRGLEWIENQVLARSTIDIAAGHGGMTVELGAFMSAEEAAALLARLEAVEFSAGDAIAAQGAPSDALYFVDHGLVSIYMGIEGETRIRLRTFGPGTIVGEMGFYSDTPRSADVVADVQTRLLKLTKEGLSRLEKENPALAGKLHRYVIRLLAGRVSAANEEIRMLL